MAKTGKTAPGKTASDAQHSPALDNGLSDHQPGAGKAPYATDTGNAGETHQDVKDGAPASAYLTDNFGHRLSDNQN
ncbi:MAG: hypothetical protein VW935_20315, partial [Novosphingobium sp.]